MIKDIDKKPSLPDSGVVLTLGVLSIVSALCCFIVPFLGLGFGIVAVVMSAKPLRIYQENPDAFSSESLNNVNTGRVCGIVGLIFSAAIFLTIMFSFGIDFFYTLEQFLQ